MIWKRRELTDCKEQISFYIYVCVSYFAIAEPLAMSVEHAMVLLADAELLEKGILGIVDQIAHCAR